MTLEHYATVRLEPSEEAERGRARVRVMPYGQTITHNGETVTYDPGSLSVPDFVPVNIDHGDGVLQRVGVLERAAGSDDGLYGELRISDTTVGRDVRTLLVDGVLTDISAGVKVDPAQTTSKGGVTHLHGTLDHIAIVTRGAFSGDATGARVLAAYQETPPMSEPAIDPATYATTQSVENLERQVAALSVPNPEPAPSRPGNFRNLHDYFITQRDAVAGVTRARERLDLYRREADAALAEMRAGVSAYALADDTTTTAAGLVPDYLSSDVIGLITGSRPFVDSIASDPVGPYGMSVVYPKIVQRPDVNVQATEKTQVTSQAMDIDPVTVDLVTYAGASDVSLQLVERSQPSFLDRLFAELAGVYAERTDAAAAAAVVTAVDALTTNEAVVADLGASASATWAAFATAAGVIAAAVKRPADTVWLGTTRFTQIMKLVDSGGRPLVVPDEGGPSNAQGVGSLSTFNFRYGGFRVIVDPFIAATTCLIGSSWGASTLELQPQQLRAIQVDLLGVNAGVWGLFATVVKYANAFYIIKAA